MTPPQEGPEERRLLEQRRQGKQKKWFETTRNNWKRQGTTHDVMKNPFIDFALLVVALPQRDAHVTSRPKRPWRHAVLCLFACYFLVAASGCSFVGGLLPGGDPMILTDVDAAGPKQITAALEATREKMQLAPREPFWPFHMGVLYAAVDSTAQAIGHLQAALNLDPDYAPAAALLSKLHYDAEDYDQAVVLLEDFLSSNPDAPDALRVALALNFEALGDLDGARTVLEHCSGNSREVRAARTFVSLRGDDVQPVLETAKQALEGNRKSAANHNNYGIALLHAGRPVEARKAFLAALKLNDKLPGALYNMAIVEAFYFFDEEEGRRWFARYKQYASDDPDDLTSVFGSDLSTLLKVEPTK